MICLATAKDAPGVPRLEELYQAAYLLQEVPEERPGLDEAPRRRQVER